MKLTTVQEHEIVVAALKMGLEYYGNELLFVLRPTWQRGPLVVVRDLKKHIEQQCKDQGVDESDVQVWDDYEYLFLWNPVLGAWRITTPHEVKPFAAPAGDEYNGNEAMELLKWCEEYNHWHLVSCWAGTSELPITVWE